MKLSNVIIRHIRIRVPACGKPVVVMRRYGCEDFHLVVRRSKSLGYRFEQEGRTVTHQMIRGNLRTDLKTYDAWNLLPTSMRGQRSGPMIRHDESMNQSVSGERTRFQIRQLLLDKKLKKAKNL